MQSEQRRLIKHNLDILLRRKRIILFFLLLGIICGLGQYLRLPKIYKCSALIKYQRQSINPTVMSPDDIRTRTKDVVDTVSQQIMSRSSLESLIKEFGLYKSSRTTTPMEDLVDAMRKNQIQTRLLQGGDVFEVSFQGTDQNKVLKVTNALAAKFIEENLRFRQERASQTSTYVRDELNMAKEALDKKELIMRDYKLKYYNEMPNQRTNNMNRLNALQEQLQNNQDRSLQLERTRLLVQEQISQKKKKSQLTLDANSKNQNSIASTEGLNDIQQVRLRLEKLKTRYTDKHPEVKRLSKILRDLEARQQDSPDGTASFPVDPQIAELKQQLEDIEFNLKRLKKERQTLEDQITKYDKWIAATPIREAEWQALTRDYEQLNAHYQRLVTKSLQAESAQSLENQLQGSQFKIIDAAHFPEKPFKPDFKKLLLMAIGIGLAVGCGLSLGIEFLSTSFKDPVELESYVGVPVACAIPTIYTKKELTQKRIVNIILNTALLLSAGAVVTATAYYWKQGVIIL